MSGSTREANDDSRRLVERRDVFSEDDCLVCGADGANAFGRFICHNRLHPDQEKHSENVSGNDQDYFDDPLPLSLVRTATPFSFVPDVILRARSIGVRRAAHVREDVIIGHGKLFTCHSEIYVAKLTTTSCANSAA